MADSKITQLTELTAPDAGDLLAIVDDPAGTPITKKIKASVLGIPVIAYKSADETVNNSDVLQDDNHLFIPIGANEVWAFTLTTIVNGDTAADINRAFSVPSGATGGWGVASGNNYNAFGAAIFQGTTTGTDIINIPVTGVVINSSTPGNLQFQWAQTIATAVDTKVLKGSFLIAHRLA